MTRIIGPPIGIQTRNATRPIAPLVAVAVAPPPLPPPLLAQIASDELHSDGWELSSPSGPGLVRTVSTHCLFVCKPGVLGR